MIETKDNMMPPGFDPTAAANSFYNGQMHAALERQRQGVQGRESPLSPPRGGQQICTPPPFRGANNSSPNSSPGSSPSRPHKDDIVPTSIPYPPPSFLSAHFSQRAASEYGLMPSPLSHSDLSSYANSRQQAYQMVSPNDPTANACKVVDFHGEKIASFTIHNKNMLCLPQAFELFLKNLVGGLHTVYTKCKRLNINPLVCNVEQVRVLRGLGAIQPGVNRCKLIADVDFEELMRDCNTSRPGRPPKRMTPLTTFSQMPGGVGDPFTCLSSSIPSAMPFHTPPGHPSQAGHGHQGLPPGFPPVPGLMTGMLGGRGGLEQQMAAQAALLSRSMMGGHNQASENMLEKYGIIMRQLQGLHRDEEETKGVSPPRSPEHRHDSRHLSPALNLSGYKSEDEVKQISADDISEDKSESELADLDDEDDDENMMSDNSMECSVRSKKNDDERTIVNGDSQGAKNMTNMVTLMSHIQDLVKTAITNAKEDKNNDNNEETEKQIAEEKDTLDHLKQQIGDAQKQSELYLKRFKKEKRLRRKIQNQLEIESFKKAKLEEALSSLSYKTFLQVKDLDGGDNEVNDKENFA